MPRESLPLRMPLRSIKDESKNEEATIHGAVVKLSVPCFSSCPNSALRRQTKTKVVSRHRCDGYIGRHERYDSCERIRDNVTNMIRTVHHLAPRQQPHNPGFLLVGARSHVVGHSHPRKSYHNRSNIRQTSGARNNGKHDYNHVKKRHVRPNLDQPLTDQIHQSPKYPIRQPIAIPIT